MGTSHALEVYWLRAAFNRHVLVFATEDVVMQRVIVASLLFEEVFVKVLMRFIGVNTDEEAAFALVL